MPSALKTLPPDSRSAQGLLPTWFNRVSGRMDEEANTYSVGGLGGAPQRV